MSKPIRIELPTEYEAGPVNAYLFLTPAPTLVDTGVKSEESWEALVAGLAAQGVAVADLARVALTHGHVDHFGHAKRLVEESGARLETADIVAERLTNFSDLWQKRIAYYREIFLPQTGLPTHLHQYILAYFDMVADNYEDIPPDYLHTYPLDTQISLGERPWRVIYTPGHCSHQTVFYQAETRQLLSSDMLLPRTPTPVVEYPPDGRTRQPSLPTFMRSLEKMEALAADVIYPGHGEIFHDHHALIEKQRGRIRRRTEETYICIKEGCRTAAAIVSRLYADRPLPIQFAGLWMALGYIDLLREDGRIRQHEEDGVIIYEPDDG
jgi:glyoxylase-like metal-dependent hydrolase (beta-lactamase superfamily II)